MRMPGARWALALTAGLVVAGCGLARAGGEGVVQQNVGIATQYDLSEKAMLVVRQNQFLIEREEYDGIFYVETRWRDRTPFPDERSLGIDAAQVRMIVRGQPRAPTPEGQLYNVTVIVEDRVSVSDGSGWRPGISSPEFRQLAARIAEDLRRELDVGVRRFGPDGGPPGGPGGR